MEPLCPDVWMIILSMVPHGSWSYCRRVNKMFLVLCPYIQVPTHQDLIWSIHNDKIECLKLLLQDPRINPSARDNYAIREASQNGHTECVRLLKAHSTETVPPNK